MKDFQRATDIRVGQLVSYSTGDGWTEPRRVISVQHNRLCGRTPNGEQVRGVVVQMEGRVVVSLDDDMVVQVEEEMAHA